MWDEKSRSELAQRLAAEQSALDSLVAEQAHIATRIAEQRGRVGMVEDLLRKSGARSRSPHQSDPSDGAAGLQAGSRIERALAYLRAEGDSRHVRDILLALGEDDTPRKRNGLSSQIIRDIKAGRHFVRDESKGRRFFAALVPDADGDPTA